MKRIKASTAGEILGELEKNQIIPPASEPAGPQSATAPTPPPKPEKRPPRLETIQVRHDFSVQETANLGKQLGEEQRKLDTFEDELASVKSEYKSKMVKVEAEINRLVDALQDGFEMRPTKAVMFVEIQKKTRKVAKCFYRSDTGEFIRREEVTLGGMELDLFAVLPKGHKPEAKLTADLLASAV